MSNVIQRSYVIAIAGGSCAGKTVLAAALEKLFPQRAVVLIPLDSYYHDLSHLPPPERAARNFDHPSALDFELFERDLRALASGGGGLIPVYDYIRHVRRPRCEWRPVPPASPGAPARLVIVEGLHALYSESARAVCDLAVFVDLAAELRLERRLGRDLSERGRSEEEVRRRCRETVEPMFERYVLPAREFTDLVLDGSRPADELAAEVAARIEFGA